MASPFPLSPKKPCKYPYMYLNDISKTSKRQKYFKSAKHGKISGVINKSEIVYAQADFTSMLDRFINKEKLNDIDQVTIHFALDDNYDFTFIFSIVSIDQPGVKMFFNLFPNGKGFQQITDTTTVDRWKENYLGFIKAALHSTLYKDPAHPKDSPNDTTSIDYDVLGLSQIQREIEYQKLNNNVTDLIGISISLASYLTNTEETRVEFSCIPQRIFTLIDMARGTYDNPSILELSDTKDFSERTQETKPIEEFDTGNLCPPHCNS